MNILIFTQYKFWAFVFYSKNNFYYIFQLKKKKKEEEELFGAV